jgi:hypothetical protein
MHAHHGATITAIRPDERILRGSRSHARSPTAFAAHVRRQAKLRRHLAGVQHGSSRSSASHRTIQVLAGRSVVVGAEIPYQSWAAAKKAENFCQLGPVIVDVGLWSGNVI